jgi:hypothetical protein
MHAVGNDGDATSDALCAIDRVDLIRPIGMDRCGLSSFETAGPDHQPIGNKMSNLAAGEPGASVCAWTQSIWKRVRLGSPPSLVSGLKV